MIKKYYNKLSILQKKRKKKNLLHNKKNKRNKKVNLHYISIYKILYKILVKKILENPLENMILINNKILQNFKKNSIINKIYSVLDKTKKKNIFHYRKVLRKKSKIGFLYYSNFNISTF